MEFWISKKNPVDAVYLAPWHSAGGARQGEKGGKGFFYNDEQESPGFLNLPAI